MAMPNRQKSVVVGVSVIFPTVLTLIFRPAYESGFLRGLLGPRSMQVLFFVTLGEA